MPDIIGRPVTRLTRLLASPTFPLVAAVLALLIAAPSLRSGWFLDDVWHRMGHVSTAARGRDDLISMRGPMRAYTFLDGSPDRTHRLMDRGLLPWWANPKVKISFWRPVSALALELDYALFPERPELMHAQSMVWFAALVALVSLLFRSVMGASWLAGLAALLYAIDDGHAIPVAWLANRHAIIAAVFAVASLLAYRRWSQGGLRGLLPLSWVLFALALLSSEAGVVSLAYFAAFALLLREGPLAARLKPLLPYLVITLAWRACYSLLGYGVAGSELYIDPLHSPLSFALAVLVRLPMLLLSSVGWPPAEIYLILSPPAGYAYSAGAWVLLLSGAVLTRRFWQRDRVACFWLAGMVGAAVPLCAAMPGSRNLMLVSLGGMAFLARLLASFLGATDRPRLGRTLGKVAFAGLGALHLLAAPAAFLATPAMLRSLNTAGLTDFGDDAAVKGRDVMLVDAPGSYVVGFLLPDRALHGRALPAHLRVLSPGSAPLEVRRTDACTLVVRPEGGYYPPPGREERGAAPVRLDYFLRRMERLPQDGSEPAALGQEVRLTNVVVTITALTADGRPAAAQFRFARPLEDPAFRWLAWDPRDTAYHAFLLPRVGETVRIG